MEERENKVAFCPPRRKTKKKLLSRLMDRPAFPKIIALAFSFSPFPSLRQPTLQASLLHTEGLHWMSITSCLCCAAASVLCFVAVGLQGRHDIKKKRRSPNAALQFASWIVGNNFEWEAEAEVCKRCVRAVGSDFRLVRASGETN